MTLQYLTAGKAMQNANDIRKFIISGKATFTVTSARTGKHFTYRVKRASEGNAFFVSVLTGSDNTRDYTYIGFLTPGNPRDKDDMYLRHTRSSKVAADAPSFRGFEWLVRRINRNEDLDGLATLDHMGKCGRCGRKLTVPESIVNGIGPECAKKIY